MNKTLVVLFILFIIFPFIPYANPSNPELKILSWNLFDFGKTKSDAENEFIANTIKDYDIVMIQEVVAKDPGGAQAVGRLGEALNKKGTRWEYRISDPTSGNNSYKKERYAFLWKPSKVSLVGRPWLEQQNSTEIDREPFYATFRAGDKTFTLVNFHAITQSMQPEMEVKYFKLLPAVYPDLNLIFCGDFNLPQSHTVFNPLKAMGYKPVLKNQKTSLRQSCIGDDCLASEFDNIFYNPAKILFVASGVVHFYRSFSSLQGARGISDHVPVYFVFQFK